MPRGGVAFLGALAASILLLGADPSLAYPVDGFAERLTRVPEFPPRNATHVPIVCQHGEGEVDFAIYRWVTQEVHFTFALDRVELRKQLEGARDPQGLVVVTFSNLKYATVLVNWLIGLRRVGVSNVFVFALDAESLDWLKAHGIPTLLIPMWDFKALWFVRNIVFRNIAEVGVEFVHSDTDAVWLRNPIPRFFARTPHSMVLSQGTLAPSTLVKEWGFTLCAGFFFCKPSPIAKEQMSRMLNDLLHNPKVPQSQTDQDSLNRAFASLKVEWHIWPNSTYAKRQFNAVYYSSLREVVGVFRDYKETIAMLPHHLVTRKAMFNRIEEPYVLHLYSHANAKSKDNLFKSHRLWFIRPDWQNVSYAGDTQAWLKACASPSLDPSPYRKHRDKKFELM